MDKVEQNKLQLRVGAIYQEHSRVVFATLVRLLQDLDLAEEALHDAFACALDQWPKAGVPENPIAWLVSAGRFKAIDAARKRGLLEQKSVDINRRFEEVANANAFGQSQSIGDDRLRLIFTCCHPSIDPSVQVALTLREVCGLSTEEVASAFLTSPMTMAQRIVRGKAKIRDGGIPIEIPQADEIETRIDSVLSVIYLAFNEGYSPTSGAAVTRADLAAEAIRLGRLLHAQLKDPEATGLLALMLLQDSRRTARTNDEGELVLLEDQDRSLWNRQYIREGIQLVEQALNTRRFGPYTLQAAIAATHAQAATSQETDWLQIVRIYDAILAIHPSPVVALNRAVAVAMTHGPKAGLNVLEELSINGELEDYHLFYAAQADLLRRLDRTAEAITAYERALELTRQDPERRFLRKRLVQLRSRTSGR